MPLRILLFVSLAASSAMAAPKDGNETYTGTAVSRRTAEFLYGEKHLLRYRDGHIAERVVLYTCRDGAPFARKIVSYVDPLAPDFHLTNAASGQEEGIRTESGGRKVFFRSDSQDTEKVGPLPRVEGLVADAGFDEFVRLNWQRLMTDKAMQMPFLVPSRLDAYSFQVQHVRSGRFEGVPMEVFRLRLSGFWGWFLPGIDVYYGTDDRTLLYFDGLSNLRNASGDNYLVRITFSPLDRRPSDERSMNEAREAQLSPCRKSPN